MKLLKFTIAAMLSVFAAGAFSACTVEETPDHRDRDYGYVQFKLYKEASYGQTKAVLDQLDYLSDAYKVKVTLSNDGFTLAQTLNLNAAGKEEAEFGLRSDKLKLLEGEYSVILFSLYDANDELIYNGSGGDGQISVVAGGLTSHDLVVDVTPRGKVRFTLVKDVKNDLSGAPSTRAVERQYTFDEIKQISLSVRNKSTNENFSIDRLDGEFDIHFAEDNEETGRFGYQTSSVVCDSLVSLPAGDYVVTSYQTYDDNGLLETNSSPKTSEFTVTDNLTTEAKVKINLYESDEYIKDGYALYAIWKALDGPNWYAAGESDVQGSNWDFNKDPDLWCDQPGVQVHSNGRVAKIVISDFGFRGDMPAELGQLTELVELYLGTHNDNQSNVTHTYDPTLDMSKSIADRSANRMEYHKEYLSRIHPATQVSEPVARGMAIKNVHIAANSLFDEGFTEDQIFNKATGTQKQIRPMDMTYGKLTNGLKSLPKEIGNLKKLEYLYIANGELKELPEEVAELQSITDLEIYNCPKMEKFPMAITKLSRLTSLNISNNSQWSSDEIYKGLDGLANGDGKESIQILYARQNNLAELPASFSNMQKIGLLDLAFNKISKLNPFGKEISPVQLYLDHNLITEFPENFCGTDDTETFSATYNKLTVFPNIFTAKTEYIIGSVDFSFNQIAGFPKGFKGINAETLTLASNPITVFPKELGETNSQVAYIILRGCEISEFPEGCFEGKYSHYFMSFDLSYNHLKELPDDFTAEDLPYLYGLDISYNSFSSFPWEPLNCSGLTILAIRCQRNANGERCLREWPTGIYQHVGLRALYIGSNDLRKINDTISYLIYYLDISDNPNITFDASDICYYWIYGAFSLIYDKTQNIIGCPELFE